MDGRVTAAVAGAALIGAAAAAVATAQPRHLADARSALVVRSATARAEPRDDAAVRGSIRAGTRLPIADVVPGDARCRFWVSPGPAAWVCGAYVEASDEPPGGTVYPRVGPGRHLPHRYGRIAGASTHGFARIEDVAAGAPVRSYRSGFLFVVTPLRARDGVRMVRMRDGSYVRRDQVRLLPEPRFAGVAVGDDAELARIGWAVPAFVDGTRPPVPVRPRPDGGRPTRRLGNLERVDVLEESHPGVGARARGGVVDATARARPVPAPLPEGLAPGERWIDVDRATQTLVAYEGERAVFATAISSGHRSPGRDTRPGQFRLWIKMASTDMDRIGGSDPGSDYSVEEVPWVQYFDDDNGLHAAYWHESFGRPMSHGCVNLAPRDARFLFDWTSPALPPGWVSVRPTPDDPGTLIRVR